MSKEFLTSAVWRQQIEAELTGNILPFWMRHALDPLTGGLIGALSNDLVVDQLTPRSAVLATRLLWTYAAAYRLYHEDAYTWMAERVSEYIRRNFWDADFGGVYWSIDAHGKPVGSHKQSYAQGFAIYAFSEDYLATGSHERLLLAQRCFDLLEAHAFDPRYGGYIEGCARDWSPLADMRLSAKEPDCPKSMNTLLHILEPYTNLLRAWESPLLRQRLKELVEIFLDRVIDPQTHHLRLFFGMDWSPQGNLLSFGHDIEASWLLVEAAEVLGDASLLARCRSEAVQIAAAVQRDGLAEDGSVLYEAAPGGYINRERHWWAQAEGMVGFYNAYQISGDPRFEQAAVGCWQFIEQYHVDRTHGEWFKVLDEATRPKADSPKIGPWECPYHHSRACYEMLRRLPHD
ncbi:MAG TPA: AGE family epimerase/isomerase [Anaerolineaceae bacterium]